SFILPSGVVPQDPGDAAALQHQLAEEGVAQPAAAGVQRQDRALQLVLLRIAVLDAEAHPPARRGLGRALLVPEEGPADGGPRQGAPAESSLQHERAAVRPQQTPEELVAVEQPDLVLARL